MKREEKIAVVRILSDMIKADSIINYGEVEQYMLLREKYSIANDDEIAATKISFADAINILVESDSRLKNSVLSDCSTMAVSDGFCARSESLLLMALKNKLLYDGDGVEIISIPKPVFNIESATVLYIESRFEKKVNDIISQNYRTIFKECKIAGFNFIYIPKVVEHYRNSDPKLIGQIIHFLAPSFTEEGINGIIDGLKNMTTSSFCKDLLCNKLGITQLRETDPAIMIKVGQSYVDNKIFANYAKIEVDDKIITTIQEFMDEFLSLVNTDVLSISTAEEKKQQFLYHGFYKQLLDIFLIRKNVRSRLFVQPYKEEIYFPDIDCKLGKVHRREKALYVLLLIMSNEGGVNFSLPQSTRQLESYNKKLQKLQLRYQMIYELFGGERDKAPDLTQPEIRRPIISCLKRSLLEMKDKLYNHEDYMITKDEFGNIRIGLETDMLFINDGINGITCLIESEVYKKIESVK